MSKIYWLASYPKSGNTWVRVLLTNYIKNEDKPAQINELLSKAIASSRVWFDEWAGIEASQLDETLVENLRPDVYRCLAREIKEPIFIKVHDSWSATHGGKPLFPADVTAGVIYIIRNPLDVAVSYSYHSNKNLETMVNTLCDPEFTTVRFENKLYEQLSQKLGSWSGHIQSWIDKSRLPIHMVRYEDLKRDTEKELGAILKFMGIEIEQKRVQKAVTFSDIKELQKQESTQEFRERASNSNGSFFRRGESDSWKEELSQDLINKIIDAHGETMKRFGYL